MTPVLLFAYGSLVSPASLAGSLRGRLRPAQGPVPATLLGYRREWNVGSDARSHPERVLVLPDGAEFTGTLAVLGLRALPGAVTSGAVYRLAAGDVEALASRERNYTARDVTGAVRMPGRLAPATPVVAFVPTPRALERLHGARSAGTAVVRLGYARGVAHAFARLGPGRLAGFRRTTTPPGLAYAPVTIALRRRRGR